MARQAPPAVPVLSVLAFMGVLLGAGGASAAPPPLPSLPGSPPAAAPSPGPAPGPASGPVAIPFPAPAAGPSAPAAGGTDGFTADQVRKGVVQVEQGGRPLAVGTVLLNDGRILTSLSALGASEQPDIRYSDGSVVKTKIGHKDKAWDLVLLIPQSGRWVDGLVPTATDPQGAELRSFLPKAGKLSSAPVAVKGRLDSKSKEGDLLRSALEIDLKGAANMPGAPLIDGTGRVVGILVRACKEGAAPPTAAGVAPTATPPCSATTIGAPVYALRGFLMKTPANAIQPAPWLGLGGAPSLEGAVKGVKIMGVAPGSPAEKAGLKAGDLPDTIVAVDGQPVETPEMLAEVIGKRAIGQQVKLLVFAAGKFREAQVTLRPAP